MCSVVSTATPWIVAHQAPLSVEFSRHEYWSRLPSPPPGDLPNPGTELTSLCLLYQQVDSLPVAPPGKSHLSPGGCENSTRVESGLSCSYSMPTTLCSIWTIVRVPYTRMKQMRGFCELFKKTHTHTPCDIEGRLGGIGNGENEDPPSTFSLWRPLTWETSHPKSS